MSVIKTYDVMASREEGKRTWMSSTVIVSGWFDARAVERNFPANMRIRGDSIEFACS